MDSLLALALLREQGHDLLAVHGHFLPDGPDRARVVEGLAASCAALDVPFHALDLHREFEARVIVPFVNGYRAGLTPNPCALCNPHMKFGVLFDAARELGADAIATGHYVRMEERAPFGRLLVRGDDKGKDQSYFLALVPLEILRVSHFPLAGVRKRKVPAILKRHGLTPPLSGESQEICFVLDDDYHAFLQARGAMPGPGSMTLADGTAVGEHGGLWRYTQGQRRGLKVAWREPLYVLGKDVAANTLIVGPKRELDAPGCVAGEVNLMSDPESWPDEVLVQTRYRQRARPCRVEHAEGKLVIHFLEPQGRPTPGQVVAVYTADGAVLAGGVIEASLD
jgi:tRNA-specific 2-thiouridylase